MYGQSYHDTLDVAKNFLRAVTLLKPLRNINEYSNLLVYYYIARLSSGINLYKVNVIMDDTNEPHDMYLDATSNPCVLVGSDLKGKYLCTA